MLGGFVRKPLIGRTSSEFGTRAPQTNRETTQRRLGVLEPPAPEPAAIVASGGPAMVVNDKYLIPGAQEPDVYANALRRVIAREAAVVS